MCGTMFFDADVLDERRLLEKGRRLLPRAAEDQGASGPLSRSLSASSACRPVASIAVMFRSRRITIGRERRQVGRGVEQLVGHAEQERAVDAEDRDVAGHVPSWRM